MLYKMLSLMLLHPNLAFLRSSRPAIYFREETEDLISRDSFTQSHAASAWESWGLNPALLTTSSYLCQDTAIVTYQGGLDALVANDVSGLHFSDVACALVL